MDIEHFIYSSDDGHLGCFHLLVIMNRASVNICVQIFVCTYVFSSLGYKLNGIAGSYKSVFNFLRNCETVFRRSCMILYSN